MAVKLNSYISFNGDGRQAADFYSSVFGGELFLDTFEKFADSMPVDEADKDKVMHAYIKGEHGVELMLSDTPTGMEYHDGMRITLTLNGDDETILRGYWDKLAEGGTVTMPLEKAPWGDVFGTLTDRFGVTWMVDIGPVQ